MEQAKIFNRSQLKNNLPDIKPGDIIVVYQKIKESGKERIQPYEGLVIARKHGKGINATITVRKIAAGVGVEKIFPIHSPTIEKIEVKRRSKVRRAKLYYIREKAVKETRKRLRQTTAASSEEPQKSEPPEQKEAQGENSVG